jgi:hypothetical protein
LFTLRRTLENLVFYVDVPGDETGTDGWVNATRRDVQESFASAINAGAIDCNTLVARRSNALSLISILHHNPGMKRKEWGADMPSEVRKLREFCDDLETMEHNASDEGGRDAVPEKPAAIDPAKTDATKTGGAEGTDKAPPRKPTTEDRMKAELASNLHEVKGWTAQQWADRLGCGKTTIIETETWKSLALLRQQMKAEKRNDRNKKQPTKTRK